MMTTTRSNPSKYLWFRIGLVSLFSGFLIIGIAYLILAIRYGIPLPTGPSWFVFAYTAWAAGWLLSALGVLIAGWSYVRIRQQ